MYKVYLVVPFHDKEEVKRLGGEWDMAKRRWFVFSDRNLNLFNRWIESDSIDVSEANRDSHIRDRPQKK